MRAQIAKTAHLPAEYIPPTFLTRYPLPLFRRFIVGAAIEKNFFDFYFSDFSPYSQNVWIENIFFIFSFLPFYFYSYFIFLFFLIFVWILVSTLFFRLSYLIISTRLKFVILYSILFFRLSIVSTRYKLSLDIHHLFRFIFITFGFLDFRH